MILNVDDWLKANVKHLQARTAPSPSRTLKHQIQTVNDCMDKFAYNLFFILQIIWSHLQHRLGGGLNHWFNCKQSFSWRYNTYNPFSSYHLCYHSAQLQKHDLIIINLPIWWSWSSQILWQREWFSLLVTIIMFGKFPLVRLGLPPQTQLIPQVCKPPFTSHRRYIFHVILLVPIIVIIVNIIP